MNKIRIFGVLLVIASILIAVYADDQGFGFVSGLLGAMGLIWLITGKMKFGK